MLFILLLAAPPATQPSSCAYGDKLAKLSADGSNDASRALHDFERDHPECARARPQTEANTELVPSRRLYLGIGLTGETGTYYSGHGHPAFNPYFGPCCSDGPPVGSSDTLLSATLGLRVNQWLRVEGIVSLNPNNTFEGGGAVGFDAPRSWGLGFLTATTEGVPTLRIGGGYRYAVPNVVWGPYVDVSVSYELRWRALFVRPEIGYHNQFVLGDVCDDDNCGVIFDQRPGINAEVRFSLMVGGTFSLQ